MRSASLRVAASVLLLCAATVAPIWSADADKGVQAITRPSDKRTLSFVRPGLVIEMTAEKGAVVTKGQIVARQDDREETQVMLVAEQDSKDDTEINAETAVREADKLDRDKKTANPSASATEKREAELKVTVDDARILLAVAKKKKAAFDFARTQAVIEKLKLVCPIDGIVSQKFMEVGEATDGQNMKVLEVVKIDPLWVEVPVPIQQARKLTDGDAASVTFLDGKTRTGKVVLKSIVADSAAAAITIRVEVPNPEKLEPGEQVRVAFPKAAVADASPLSR